MCPWKLPNIPMLPIPTFHIFLLSPVLTAGPALNQTYALAHYTQGPGKWLVDHKPSDVGIAWAGSTGKQGMWLLLYSLPSALHVGIRPKMESEHNWSPCQQTKEIAQDTLSFLDLKVPWKLPKVPYTIPCISYHFSVSYLHCRCWHQTYCLQWHFQHMDMEMVGRPESW